MVRYCQIGLLLIYWMLNLTTASWFGGMKLKTHNVGRYKVIVENLTVCREGLLKTNSRNFITLEAGKNGESMIVANITIIKTMKQTIKEKLAVWIKKDRKYEKLFTYMQSNICLCGLCMEKLYSMIYNIKKVGSSCIIEQKSKYCKFNPNVYAHAFVGNTAVLGRQKIRFSHFTTTAYTLCIDFLVNIQAI